MHISSAHSTRQTCAIHGAVAKLFFTIISLLPMAAFAAHPLVTEDSGVQGEHNWQFELNTDRAIERDTRFSSQVVNATLTYGLADTLDLAFNMPWQRNEVSDSPRQFYNGAGDASIFMKWRVYENDKLSLAIKPLISLTTGNSDKGLGSDRMRPRVTGISTWGDERLSLSANLGYTYNDNTFGDRKSLWNLSGSVVAGLFENLRGVLEVGAYTNSDSTVRQKPACANVGLIYSPHDKLDFDLGYKRGLNKAEALYSVGAGVTVRW